jgi:hypothetical protein
MRESIHVLHSCHRPEADNQSSEQSNIIFEMNMGALAACSNLGAKFALLHNWVR